MPSICCVPQFENRGGGLKFPIDKALRNRWIIAIKRDKWKPEKSHVVCYKHFSPSDYNNTACIDKLYSVAEIGAGGHAPPPVMGEFFHALDLESENPFNFYNVL